MTEGKGFCRRRQERNAEKSLKQDLEHLDKIIIIKNEKNLKRSLRS